MKKSRHLPKKAPRAYPVYPADQDIYRQNVEDSRIDPDDLKFWDEETDPQNALRGETPVDTTIMGSDLDVPGAELDDAQEKTGSEDEENNYYSLGGEKELEQLHPEDF